MFKKVKCNNCENHYDETFDECPNCHSPNGELNPNFKHIQMLKFGKQIALFLTGLFGFEILGIIVSLIFSLFGFTSNNQVLVNMVLNAVVYGLLFIILFAIVNVDVKKLLKSFKRWQPFVAGLCCFGALIGFSIIYGILLQIFRVNISSNENQTLIDVTTNSYPITALVIFGFIGPICEELTYRVGLFSFLKRFSKWLAYPVSILVFALIHFSFDPANIVNELINLPVYIFAGFALTFTYDKFGFAGSLFAHILNNVISFIPAIVILGVII